MIVLFAHKFISKLACEQVKYAEFNRIWDSKYMFTLGLHNISKMYCHSNNILCNIEKKRINSKKSLCKQW